MSQWQCRSCRAVLERDTSTGPPGGVSRRVIAGADVKQYAAGLAAAASWLEELRALEGDARRLLLVITEEVRNLVAGKRVWTTEPGVVVVEGGTEEGGDIVLKPKSGRELITFPRAAIFGLPEAPPPAAEKELSLLAWEKTSFNRTHRAVFVPRGTPLSLTSCSGYPAPPGGGPTVHLYATPPDPGPRFRSWTGLERLYVPSGVVTLEE